MTYSDSLSIAFSTQIHCQVGAFIMELNSKTHKLLPYKRFLVLPWLTHGVCLAILGRLRVIKTKFEHNKVMGNTFLRVLKIKFEHNKVMGNTSLRLLLGLLSSLVFWKKIKINKNLQEFPLVTELPHLKKHRVFT